MTFTFLQISTTLLWGLIGQGVVALISFTVYYVFRYRSKKQVRIKTYSERLTELTSNLTKSTKEVDLILKELLSVAKDKEDTLAKLSTALFDLEKREVETKKRVEDLQNIPIAVADHFAQLANAGERISAKRDYLLFAAGVIVSIILSFIFMLLSVK
jgi:hypothetical protein